MTPRYFSTRDPERRLVSFEDALLKGLAADGGLYLPNHIPKLPATDLQGQDIRDIAQKVLSAWLASEIPAADLRNIIDDALNFPLPVKELSEDLFILELFHGPTLSFKDVAARTMARLMQYFLTKRAEKRLILVATSGDTGSAVADGFAGQANIEVILLYPKGKVSAVQERQLIVERPGVRSFAIRGTFDDCQRMVKEAFTDPELAHLPLSSANSINIGRLLPQSLYYLWAAQVSAVASPLFCVPSGNLGNLTGGILAQQMGLEVSSFIAAHNANHYFPDFLAGRSAAFAFHPTIATVSNAMDVGSPSNFERLYHLMGAECLREHIWSTVVDDEVTLNRIKMTYASTGYIACPHTAVGLEAVSRYRSATSDNRPIISLACAHPAKFPDAISNALGITAAKEAALEQLFGQPTAVQELEPQVAALKAALL